MPATVLHLLRHGEVDNPRGVLYGKQPGYHLSALGQAMAERIAVSLAGREIARVVASPLERAEQTAAPVARAFGLEARADARLIEASSVFEGRTFGVGDGALRKPESWKHLWNPFRPSWGEPYRHVVVRMLAAMAEVCRAVEGREALLVSHQLPIWTVRCYLEGRRLWHDPRRRQCGLASLTSVTYQADRVTSVAYTEPAADLLPVRATSRFVAGA